MSPSGVADGTPESAFASAILERLVAITTDPVWPEFAPATMPLAIAIHDVGATWRSVSDADGGSAAEVVSVAGSLPMGRSDGIDPRIVANSWADFDGVPTATVIVPAGTLGGVDARWDGIAGLAVHELFHVHQAERGFAPGGNEAVLLTAPWDDPERLALARVEGRALRRAVETPDDARARAALREALALRRERAARLDAGELTYVRDIEVKEGTATYVEVRSRRNDGLSRDWTPEASLALRQRCYDTGLAWCLLLDRFGAAGWKMAVATPGASHLDALASELADAAGAEGAWRDLVPAATDDIARERTRRRERLAALHSPDRHRLAVRPAPGLDLTVAGFDPLNLLAVDAATVLHERYLELAAGDARLTVLDRPAITTGAGDHPLFGGLREAEVSGDGDGDPLWPSAHIWIEGDHTVTERADRAVEIVLGTPA